MTTKMISEQSLSPNKLICLLFLLIATGCSYQESSLLRANSIIYCSEGSPETFNPQLTTHATSIDATAKQFYSTLVSLQPDNSTIAPALAKSWHLTDDGKWLTLYLRQKVSFHKTDYFTPSRFLNADDIVFSFRRILDSTHPFHDVSGGHYPFFTKIGFHELVKNIEKVDQHTVRFALAQPDSSLLSNLASNFAVILSKEYADQLLLQGIPQQLDSHPIGTGPFKLKNYQVGSYIRYQPHLSYWGQAPQIEQLVFDITPSNTGRLTKLLAGECDIVNDPIAHGNIKHRPALQLNTMTSFNVSYLALNTSKAPLNNTLVRQALHQAIDKQRIIETIFFDKADIAHTIVPNNSWAYTIPMPPYVHSTLKATEQLILAGYPQGLTLTLLIKADQHDYNPDAIAMAAMIQEDLAPLDIQLDVVLEHGEQYNSLKMSDRNYDLILTGWVSKHAEPNNVFKPLLSCQGIAKQTNKSQWCDQKYDLLIQKAITTSLIDERKHFYQQAIARINEESPLIPITHAKQYLARSKNVSGKLLSPFGGINFHSVRKN